MFFLFRFLVGLLAPPDMGADDFLAAARARRARFSDVDGRLPDP